MPIYEYACGNCKHEFEALVLKGTVPVCPQCASEQLERRLSLPAVKSDKSSARALKAAQKRNAAKGAEREHAQREYEAHHDD